VVVVDNTGHRAVSLRLHSFPVPLSQRPIPADVGMLVAEVGYIALRPRCFIYSTSIVGLNSTVVSTFQSLYIRYDTICRVYLD